MNDQLMKDLEYWTQALKETDDLIGIVRTKMYSHVLPLSIEEQYRLRELITRQSAQLYHLKNTVYKIREEDDLKWYRIFRKRK